MSSTVQGVCTLQRAVITNVLSESPQNQYNPFTVKSER